MIKEKYTYKNFIEDNNKIIEFLKEKYPNLKKVYGIPRGGLISAVILSHKLGLSLILDKNEIDDTTVVIDDIIDTGNTISKLKHKGLVQVCLFYKSHSKFTPTFYVNNVEKNKWIIFPFETESSSKYDNL